MGGQEVRKCSFHGFLSINTTTALEKRESPYFGHLIVKCQEVPGDRNEVYFIAIDDVHGLIWHPKDEVGNAWKTHDWADDT
jgi:hypothetical protein